MKHIKLFEVFQNEKEINSLLKEITNEQTKELFGMSLKEYKKHNDIIL